MDGEVGSRAKEEGQGRYRAIPRSGLLVIYPSNTGRVTYFEPTLVILHDKNNFVQEIRSERRNDVLNRDLLLHGSFPSQISFLRNGVFGTLAFWQRYPWFGALPNHEDV